MAEVENSVTAIELYNKVFEGYDSSKEKSRISKIFNQESELNKRLNEYAKLVKKYVPDLEEELEKLGFYHHKKIYYPSYVTPDLIEYYSNDEGDIIQIIIGYGSLVADFNGVVKTFENKCLGENEKEFLEWLKRK